MRWVLLISLAATACSVRQLQRMERWQAGGELELDARGIRRELPEPSDTVDAGLGLRAHGGPGALGLALGLDLHLAHRLRALEPSDLGGGLGLDGDLVDLLELVVLYQSEVGERLLPHAGHHVLP